jgi:hypothetical protein
MPKKNKLNSKNPKWKKNQKDKQPDVDKILVKETKGIKVYFIFEK